MALRLCPAICLLGVIALMAAHAAPPLLPAVETEESIYTYTPADNGAGPLWCYGSTCLVRIGDRLFASGLETLKDQKPLNNCRWLLFKRSTRSRSRSACATRRSPCATARCTSSASATSSNR